VNKWKRLLLDTFEKLSHNIINKILSPMQHLQPQRANIIL